MLRGLALFLYIANELWKRKQYTRYDEGKTQLISKEMAPATAYQKFEHATEDQHRTAEEYNWRRENVLSLLTAIVAVVAVVLTFITFIQTRRQADIAQRALIESTRAWMDVIASPDGIKLSWNDSTGLTISISLQGQNKGISPGMNVMVFPRLRIDEGGFATAISSDIRKACQGFEPIGNTVFTGEPLTRLLANTLHADKIQAYRRVRSEIPAGQPFPIPLQVVACVSYKVGGDVRPHYTAKVYRLEIYDHDATGQLFSRDPLIGQDVSDGRIGLRRELDGEYAD